MCEPWQGGRAAGGKEEHSEQREESVQSSVGEGLEPPSRSGDGVKGSLHLASQVTSFVFLEAVGSHWNVLRSWGRHEPHI